MERWSGKIAVVTGAASGIGLAISKAFVSHGLIVIGIDQNDEKLQLEAKSITGSGKFITKSCDITKENDVIQTFKWIEKNYKTVHIQANIAGVLESSTIQDMKSEDLHKVMNVNVMGLLYCTRQALNLMKKNVHEAHIINMNSIAGHVIFDLVDSFSIYSVSKHAVTAITDSLVNELNSSDNKIRVTSISPGAVKTNIFAHCPLNLEAVEKATFLNPEDVAASVVHVVGAPPHVQIKELTIEPMNFPYFYKTR